MQTKIPVGVTTQAGYGVSAVAFVLAIVAFATGSHDDQTLGTIVAGAVGLISLALTQFGRYWQAKALAMKPSPSPVAYVGSSGVPAPKVHVDFRLEQEPIAGEPLADDLPDAEEFAAPPPDLPVQPSQAGLTDTP